MKIERIEEKWYKTIGEGYSPTRIYLETDAWDLIEKNNLELIRKDDEYELYE